MKTVFNMKNLMIMKNYNKYICAFVLLLGMSVNAWGTKTYTYNMTYAGGSGSAGSDVSYWYSESTCTTHCKIENSTSNRFTSATTIYYKDATLSSTAFTVTPAGTGNYATFKLNSTACYFFLGKQNATLTLPTYSGEKITNVTITRGAGGSNSATVNIFSGTNAASDQQTFASAGTGYSFNIKSSYQTDALTIKLVGDFNTSFNQIVITTEPSTFTVTYNDNGKDGGGATPTDASSPYDPNSTVTVLGNVNSMTRAGHTFNGWNTKADGSGVDFAAGATFTITKDTTFYAKWSVNSHTLAVANEDNVVISSTSPSVAEGASTSVNYGTTVTLSHGEPEGGRLWGGWKVYKTGDENTVVSVDGENQFSMPDYDVTVSANIYGDFVFSCSELTVTAKPATASTPIFITSRAEQTVRSQDSILVVGNGLTPSTTLEFPGLPSKFEIKTRTGSVLSTDENGEIDAVAYIYYTPGAGDTSDGLDKLTGITVSVGGAKPKTATLTQGIIGRHLPADFVIAAKYNGKWYALPDTMTGLRNPEPIEIAVDDADNPTMAYTANTNFYKLYGQSASTDGSSNPGKLYSNGEMIKLGMTNNGTYANYPLFGSSTGTATLGKGGSATTITNNIGAQYWWKLAQKNPSITNPQDAKYIVYAANNTSSLRIKNKPNQWGFYASGVDTIRLIPAIAKNVVEAYFIEYGQHGGIIEVDKGGMGAYYVKAKLNGNESGLEVFYETQTSVLYGSTKYNYTVNFGDAIDFAAADAVGKILTLEWYDGLENMVGVTTIELPKIIASDATMTTISSLKRFWENMEVHVLPGATLTANAYSFSGNNVTIKQLEIYPGAKVNVSTGTLNVTDLMLRNGWTRAGSKNYGAGKMVIAGSANLMHTNAYLDLYIDNDQYYPLAVPFPVTVENIKYVYSNRSFTVGGPTGEVRLRYYDGASRAEGKVGNWKFYGAIDCLEVPETLVPSMGYAIAVKRPAGKAFSVLRLPLTFADAWTTGGEHGSATVDATPLCKDTVHVYAYGNAKTAENNKGWNLIGNPYMTVYNGDDDEDGIYGKLLAVTNKEDAKAEKVRYVTIPNSSFTDYTQVNYVEANIQPYSSFLIQAKDTCRIEFSDSKIIPSAPAQYTATPAQMSEQEAYIRLTGAGEKDQMGLIIGEDYTAAYETNADLAKMHGELNTLKTYMVYDSVDMAYLAINEQLARAWIPVTVRIPESGEYTYSLRTTSVVNELEGIYLIDYQTNTVTNLIENNYSFMATEGTIAGRFAINAIVGKHDTPTDVDIIHAGGDIKSNQPFKFIYNDKVFILHNGVIYDSTGKKVREIKK